VTIRNRAVFVFGDGFDEIPGLFAGPGGSVVGMGCVGFEDVGFYYFRGGLFDYVFDGACRTLVLYLMLKNQRV
jgi:hypothetical protein